MPTPTNRVRGMVSRASGELIRWAWAQAGKVAAIGPSTKVARGFGTFGDGSVICFPTQTVVNPQCIHLGVDTIIAPEVTLSAGWGPGQQGLPDRVVSIGDRCLIGRGSGIVAHRSIEIGDDVWTGHNVYLTDMNHGYEDVELPISVQNQPEAPVSIGDGSWLGHGVVVLPGARIGRHVVIGANSVVTGEIPDFSVAVGAPARVIRVHHPEQGWVDPCAAAAVQGVDAPRR
jgi:acetyltransferase-like isoleucine patch superfamily enzyme